MDVCIHGRMHGRMQGPNNQLDNGVAFMILSKQNKIFPPVNYHQLLKSTGTNPGSVAFCLSRGSAFSKYLHVLRWEDFIFEDSKFSYIPL